MAQFSIENKKVILPLTFHRSKIRIADQEGNHISKTTNCVIQYNYAIEWMITNDEIQQLIPLYLSKDDRLLLIEELSNINLFIRETEYVKREATKGKVLNAFEHFEVFEYIEKFYSFETSISNGIKFRVAIKMEDFSLNPHFFILIAFEHDSLTIRNYKHVDLKNGEMLGSKAYGIWTINASIVKDIIKTIAYTSTDHKNDMINLIKN